MKITFLGTGTSMGIPVIGCGCDCCASHDTRDKRLRTSVMLETGNTVIVVDTGPDFRQQMLREQVKRLDAVIITHSHKDHIGGLDDLRPFNYFMNKSIDVYTTPDTHASVIKDYSYIFADDPYPGAPEINITEVGNKPFLIGNLSFTPIHAGHYRMQVMGFRTGDFTYLTDANAIAPDELAKITGTKTLVINALRKKKHPTHFNLSEALGIIDYIKPKTAYLTHVSHQMGKHADISKELPEHVHMAYDGLKIFI